MSTCVEHHKFVCVRCNRENNVTVRNGQGGGEFPVYKSTHMFRYGGHAGGLVVLNESYRHLIPKSGDLCDPCVDSLVGWFEVDTDEQVV